MLAELIALKFAADPAFMHDQDTVAHPDNLLHVAGNHQQQRRRHRKEPVSGRRFRSWRRRRFHASAHRTASRWATWPAIWQAPLFAGCRRTAFPPRLIPMAARMLSRPACCLADSSSCDCDPADRQRQTARRFGSEILLVMSFFQDQPRPLAVLRDEVDAVRDRIARRLMVSGRPSTLTDPPMRPVNSEDGAREFGSSGPDQPRQADDLAAPQTKN